MSAPREGRQRRVSYASVDCSGVQWLLAWLTDSCLTWIHSIVVYLPSKGIWYSSKGFCWLWEHIMLGQSEVIAWFGHCVDLLQRGGGGF